jgi:hypothetical protein
MKQLIKYFVGAVVIVSAVQSSAAVALTKSKQAPSFQDGVPSTLDPIKDTFGEEPVQLDISAIDAIFTKTEITFEISFFTPISPASAFADNSVVGIIDIDTDRDETTGVISAQSFFAPPPPSGLGVEFIIDLLSENRSPGFVDVVKPVGPNRGEVVGNVAIAFTANSLSVTVPLTFLGNDDGLVNYGTVIGTYVGPVIGTFVELTDEAPNNPVATSRSVPEPSLIAGLLILGVLGTRSLLKRQQRQQESL